MTLWERLLAKSSGFSEFLGKVCPRSAADLQAGSSVFALSAGETQGKPRKSGKEKRRPDHRTGPPSWRREDFAR